MSSALLQLPSSLLIARFAALHPALAKYAATKGDAALGELIATTVPRRLPPTATTTSNEGAHRQPPLVPVGASYPNLDDGTNSHHPAPRQLTVEDFGYHYDESGKLVSIRNGEPFVFMGQKHYDGLGDAVVATVYRILQERFALRRVPFPPPHAFRETAAATTRDAAMDTGASVPIFVSDNYASCEVLVVLCQGSGAVRPGMWARALCINQSLNEGAIFNYLEMIRARGWGVIVLNPNENRVVMPSSSAAAEGESGRLDASAAPSETGDPSTSSGADSTALEYWLEQNDAEWRAACQHRARLQSVSVPLSSSPEQHACNAYEAFVRGSGAKYVMIVAHSYGGVCTTSVVERHIDDVERRVVAIALTDAINHEFCPPRDVGVRRRGRELTLRCRKVMSERSVNWVSSSLPLDTDVTSRDSRCQERSAGHLVHEFTSEACRTALFQYLDGKLMQSIAKSTR